MENTLTIRGREITDSDVHLIRSIVQKYFHKGRKYISRQICCEWKWYQPNGQPKDMACRYILLSLEQKGFIRLPVSRHPGNNRKRIPEKIKLSEVPLEKTVGDYREINLHLLTESKEYNLGINL